MPTPKRGPRLGSGPAHQKQLLAGLASDLFRHGRITTTEAKAKALRPYAERLITKGKRGDLHARRQVLAKLHDRDVVAYLFEDVAPRFAERNGGYTRIVKLGPRRGDNAPMAIIELVDQGAQPGAEAIEDSKRGRTRGLFGRRRRQQAEPALAVPGLAPEAEPEPEFDVEDDAQVAAAIAQATGADVAADEDATDAAPADTDADEADGDADPKAGTDDAADADADDAADADAVDEDD